MTEVIPLAALGVDLSTPAIHQLGMADPVQAATSGTAAPAGQFEQLLSSGLEAVDAKVATANDLVRQFALDDSVPLHEVTFALEEARLSMELAMHVRERLVETYRELMNMQI